MVRQGSQCTPETSTQSKTLTTSSLPEGVPLLSVHQKRLAQRDNRFKTSRNPSPGQKFVKIKGGTPCTGPTDRGSPSAADSASAPLATAAVERRGLPLLASKKTKPSSVGRTEISPFEPDLQEFNQSYDEVNLLELVAGCDHADYALHAFYWHTAFDAHGLYEKRFAAAFRGASGRGNNTEKPSSERFGDSQSFVSFMDTESRRPRQGISIVRFRFDASVERTRHDMASSPYGITAISPDALAEATSLSIELFIPCTAHPMLDATQYSIPQTQYSTQYSILDTHYPLPNTQ